MESYNNNDAADQAEIDAINQEEENKNMERGEPVGTKHQIQDQPEQEEELVEEVEQ